VGRDALLEAAADLLAEIDLSTVAGAVVGVRAVAARAGVAPATVNHHFRPGEGGPNARLAGAATLHALARAADVGPSEIASDALDTVVALQRGDPDALRRMASIAARDVLWYDPHRDTTIDALNGALYLAVAAAPRSPEAVEALRAHYEITTQVYEELYGALLEATRRRPLENLDVRAFTAVFSALADGFIQRRRFDPDHAPAELFGAAVVRVFEALSTPEGAPEDHDPADNLVPLPPGSNLDVHKREAIARAAGDLYRRDGWDAVSIAAVQRRAGVSRATVLANFADRDGLAAAVWAHFLPSLQAELDEPMAVHRLVHRYLEHVARLAHEHHALTVAMNSGVMAHQAAGTRPGTDPTDPRAMVPIGPILRPHLSAHASAFRPGQVDTHSAARDSADLLVGLTLRLAITRPAAGPRAIATRVCDTLLAGMLRRRPTTW